ncbi:ribose ABC transporter ATP-binding protein [Scopulibacillus darangshiensis]|uniref:Ribose ABC transporter ATP-binding protein n=1 Tax=Scopulibacillus darangshiensis TaxID=442528 RepID=A0A4R2NSZ9_9BACL|nr:sugar ABC transporter ATP-binding protein [Scopulibacillus darangshiensis]TCP24967.1 ribose ABC transporter ATP-binding protein [Scopulibacillus darangshiensis]
MKPIISMTNISKSFSGNKVLNDVSLDIFPGEIHALMGENGAGKSTLMKILTGIYSKDGGTIEVNGATVHFKDAKEAEHAGISVIHQELNIIPYLSVMENMFLGKQLTYGKTGILKTAAMKKETKRRLSQLGIAIEPEKTAGDLSVGHQQMVEIAKALATDAKVLIMDEPTAALTDREIETLFKVMNGLRKQGVAIVYISHRMEEIFRMCDRISVLRDGKYIGTKPIQDTTMDEIIKMMVGRELGDLFPDRDKSAGKEFLRVEDLSGPDLLENVSFSVKEGEVLGVAGLMGAGRSEIVETLFGARAKSGGKIFIEGKQVKIKNPFDAKKAGIAFVTEDRKSEGLILGMSVRKNMSLPNLKTLSNQGIISSKREKASARNFIDRLNIKTHSPEADVKNLSGGNQQKVVIGKWLGINPKILILDEPTRGVDIGAKKEIYNIINELTEQGVAIIMISSELPEVLGMSDRIMVIHEGRVARIIDKKDANQENIMQAATGGE